MSKQVHHFLGGLRRTAAQTHQNDATWHRTPLQRRLPDGPQTVVGWAARNLPPISGLWQTLVQTPRGVKRYFPS